MASVELCDIARKLKNTRELLAYPDIDDNDWIIEMLMKTLDVKRGEDPVEFDCPYENEQEWLVSKLAKLIDKSKLSILRGMHSGDKVANILVDEIEAVNLICIGMEFRCHECCGDTCVVSCGEVAVTGSPMCPTCDKPMGLISAPDDIMRTDAHKEAEAYVLRIKTVRNSKDKS